MFLEGRCYIAGVITSVDTYAAGYAVTGAEDGGMVDGLYRNTRGLIYRFHNSHHFKSK